MALNIERLGSIGKAHLFVVSQSRFDGLYTREHRQHMGVLSSIPFQDVIRKLVPVGEDYPGTFDEMRAFITKAAAAFPGEVVPFEVADVTVTETW